MIIYGRELLGSSRNITKPIIVFSKSGLTRVNPAAVELIGLKIGDELLFGVHESSFYAFKGENGFIMRKTRDGQGRTAKSLVFVCIALSKLIKKHFGVSEDSKIQLKVIPAKTTGHFELKRLKSK